MSDQVNVGDYSLEISGEEVVVRDESGTVVETVELDDIDGELTLPDGRTVDLASLLADSDLENFETAAGPANDNIGIAAIVPPRFGPFADADDAEREAGSAGALDGTSLSYDAPPAEIQPLDGLNGLEAGGSFAWSRHDSPDEDQNIPGNHFGSSNDNGYQAEEDEADERNDDFNSVFDDYQPANDDVSSLPSGEPQQPHGEDSIDEPVGASTRGQQPTDAGNEGEDLVAPTLDESSSEESSGDGVWVAPADEPSPEADGRNEESVTPPVDEQQSTDDNAENDASAPIEEQEQPAAEDSANQDPSEAEETPPAEPAQDSSLASEELEADSDTETPPVQDAPLSVAANTAPTDIDLSGSAVVENTAGAIIGTLTIVDADAGDAHTFAISDDRFEVVGGQLKLKNGISLNFESEPSVSVMVAATDSAGNTLSETFTLSVGDVNEAQTALSLDGDQVSENLPGAVVGTLTVVDPDAGDHQSFAVSDSRFEVVNGELKLKDGVSLDYEAEQSVTVTVTATDDGGHSVQRAFAISFADAQEAPAVAAAPRQALWTSQLGNGQTTLGSGDDDLYIDTKSFNPVRMGDGYDTAHVARNGADFGHAEAIKLDDVEKIDTTGYGVNTVSLSINDVLDMTDGDNRLTILGDKGDNVTLTGNGNNHWTIVSSNADFTTYAYSDPSHQAIVEISNQLNAQVS